MNNDRVYTSYGIDILPYLAMSPWYVYSYIHAAFAIALIRYAYIYII